MILQSEKITTDDGKAIKYKLFDNGRFIGRISVLIKNSFVFDFYVLPKFRNKGYGTYMLNSVDGKMLYVQDGNRAISLYERCGFRRAGRKGEFIIMEKDDEYMYLDTKKEIENALNNIKNSGKTASEKIVQLNKYKEKMSEKFKNLMSLIDDAIYDTKEGYTYCPECDKWYKNAAWEVKVNKEQRKVASISIPPSFCASVDENDIVYAMKDVIIRRLECPVGHLTPYKNLDVK